MYPQIPTVTPNPTIGLPYKLPIQQLAEIYNDLTALGMCVVAKRRTGKFPVQKWQSLTHQELNMVTQMQLQSQDYVSGWCVLTGEPSDNLVVIDLDFEEIRNGGNNPDEIYKAIQDLSSTRFVLLTPTGGVHLYYRSNGATVGTGAGVGYPGLDVRGSGGLVVSLGGFNRYEDNWEKKGVVQNHEAGYEKLPDGDYSHVPEMSEQLYEWLSKHMSMLHKKETVGQNFGTDDMVRNYANTADGNRRLEAHFSQPMNKREAVVLECLDVIFKKWGDGLSNDEWTQIWMSAFHGAPTNVTLDAILSNPNVHWSDGNKGKMAFQKRWKHHKWQEEGYTVASLFWIARKAGWLRHTGYEIPESSVEHIDVQYITDWLDMQETVPERLLIESQTGSGKTTALKSLWVKAGKPKTVIFVPTVKLATELYHNLKQVMPAVLYRDEDGGSTLEVDAMKEAHVLVTTLQTFATRIYASGMPMSSYGLVYLEEIDQLVSGFARGGGGFYNSHVSEKQARLGFEALFEAYQSSKYVWGVDATMSQVSKAMVDRMSRDPVRVIRNLRIADKAQVYFVGSYDEAYQVGYDRLKAGKTVVFIADTVAKAEEAHNLMLQMKVVNESNSIIITRPTAQKKGVVEFMKDVNLGAASYKLVVYNSIMGSGVSIDKFTPDVIIQMAHYLTPRSNLQMLNRYRKQAEVYCYYQHSENLYTKTARDILDEVKKRVEIEANLIRLPVIARTDIAKLRDGLAAISIADEQAQRRSPYMLYQALLEKDGRSVRNTEFVISGVMQHNIKRVRELQSERKDHIARFWHTVRPITDESPPDATMDNMEVALGLHHGTIHHALHGHIPTIKDAEFAEYVSNVVTQMRKYSFVLSEFMTQDKAMTRAERYILDGNKALTAIHTNISTIKAVSLVRALYGTMNRIVSADELDTKAKTFVNTVRENAQLYDSVVTRNDEKWDMVYDPNDEVETAIQLAKVLLRQIGLKQKKKRDRTGGNDRRSVYIGNLNEASDFLRWRNADDPDFKVDYGFTTTLMDDVISNRANATEVFRTLEPEQREQVTQLVLTEGYTFQQAVETMSGSLIM